MVGRRPKPTALKIMQGNPGKRPLNNSEPTPTGTPTCPRHLSKEAKAEWRRISEELSAMGLLTKVDRAALAAYCEAWARWCEAERQIQKFGLVVKSPSGYPMQNPYVGIANTALDQMRKFLVEFGMTPSSRSRLSVETTPKESKLADLYPKFQRVRVTVHCPEPVEGWFDGKRLRRAFFNLLYNACEVVPSETGAIEIDIRRAYMKTEVRVTDNGPGVPEEIRRSLFDPFVSSGKNKGTGLGLAIVLKNCRDHGGDVELEESIPGRTTFKVVLPLSNFEDNREDQNCAAVPTAITDYRPIRRGNFATTLIQSILSGIPLSPFCTWRRG